MANACSHNHHCCRCSKAYLCQSPECMTLTGYQLLCDRCGYLYGWRQRQDRDLNDWSAL